MIESPPPLTLPKSIYDCKINRSNKSQFICKVFSMTWQTDSQIISKLILGLSLTNRCYCRSFPERHKNVDWLNFYRFQLGLEQTKPWAIHWNPANLHLQCRRCDINVKRIINPPLNNRFKHLFTFKRELFSKISFSSTKPPPAVELLPISAQLTMATYNHGLSFDFIYANPRALVFGCLYPSSARLAWLEWNCIWWSVGITQKPIKCTQPAGQEIISMRVIKLWKIIMSCGSWSGYTISVHISLVHICGKENYNRVK